MAEKAANSAAFEVAGRFNDALAPVNAILKAPSEYARVGVSANPAYISVAFGPRELTPPTDGSMTGLLRWDGSQFSPRNGYQGFDIRATVQTGPTPLYTANAEAPHRQIGVFEASPAGPTACAFTLTGLANGWPNVLTARIVDGSAGGGGSLYRVSHSLGGDGWDGRNVIPQPVASGRNYAVGRSIDATASKAGDFASPKKVAERRVNPVINPADDYSMATDGARKGDTVSLNPQPLPPGPDRQRSQDAVKTKGADAGIIIVSGKDADPLAKRLPAADRVFGAGVGPAAAGSASVRGQSAAAGDTDALAAKGAGSMPTRWRPNSAMRCRMATHVTALTSVLRRPRGRRSPVPARMRSVVRSGGGTGGICRRRRFFAGAEPAKNEWIRRRRAPRSRDLIRWRWCCAISRLTMPRAGI